MWGVRDHGEVRGTGLGSVLRAVLPPRVYYLVRAPVQRLPGRAPPRHVRARERRIRAAVRATGGSVVQQGPFRGMRYLRAVSWGQLVPKLLGSYEAELHDELERLVARGYDRVVNVGCAEGYYAVGLALRLPSATVHAFDSDAHARYLCGRLAAMNGVQERVRVEGTCSLARLGEVVEGRALLVVDCEGCELSLLRPDLVPALTGADLVVELHDFLEPSTSATVLTRFSATHHVTTIDSVERDPAAYPSLAGLSSGDRLEAVAEHRPGRMQWAVLRALAGPSPGAGTR